MEQLPRTAPKQGRGLSAFTLKAIAIAAMFIDHAAWAFVPNYYSGLGVAMHFIGRITGPTMFYFIVEGYHKTRNANRYTLRLLVFAALSWQPFIWFSTGLPLPTGWAVLDMNVIYTLLLGLLALRAIHEVGNPLLKGLVVVGCLLLAGFGDWGYLAVLIILLFDMFRGNFRYQAAAYCAVVALQVLPPLWSFFNQLLQGQGFVAASAYLPGAIVQCGMFLPIALLAFYKGAKGPGGPVARWGFYVFYPLHLAVLALARWGLPW